jgi:hypothetical protein
MDFGLTQTQKAAALSGAKSGLALEMYNMLIRLGVDPDTYVDGDEIEVSPQLIGEKERFQILLDSYKAVVLKLSEM